MELDGIGEIIATRQLHFRADDNTEKTVSVFVGKPQPSPESGNYFCRFRVIGIGSQQTQSAQGRDSMHALQSALILIGANLNHLNDRLGRRLSWDGDVQGELGFP